MLLLALFPGAGLISLFLPAPVFERINIMALFSKLFIKECDPYDLKGRWYTVKVRSSAVESSDCNASISVSGSNNIVMIGKPLSVTEIKFLVRKKPAASTSSPVTWYARSDGTCTVPVSQNFTDFDLYVYGVKW